MHINDASNPPSVNYRPRSELLVNLFRYVHCLTDPCLLSYLFHEPNHNWEGQVQSGCEQEQRIELSLIALPLHN